MPGGTEEVTMRRVPDGESIVKRKINRQWKRVFESYLGDKERRGREKESELIGTYCFKVEAIQETQQPHLYSTGF